VRTERTGTATLSLHRIWNQNWHRNGRLYGCWVQNLPKENRRTLLLNGEPVAEPDYPALHCGLIYDLAGKPMPDKPFEIDGFERSEVKRAFYTMVNAPSWDSAQRAIWPHSKRWKELMPAIARKHSAVKDALCSGIGAQLMFTDATIMCRNLADLNRHGIVALPIHDSVIVQAKHKGVAFEIMERNLALKSSPHKPPKSAHKSASQVADKAQGKAPPHLIPHLHNGHSGAGRVSVCGLSTSAAGVVSAYNALWHTPVAVPFKGLKLKRLFQRQAIRPDGPAVAKYIAAWCSQDLATAAEGVACNAA
jgi:hypothetical protein